MAKSAAILDLPVTFAGLSIGERTCRLGMSVSRANYTVNKADKQLVGKRLTVKLTAVPKDQHPDQRPLPGMDDGKRTVEAVGDCKGFSASGNISFGLTFMLESVDVEELSHFPKRDGSVIVTGVEEIPEGDSEDGEEGVDE